MRVRCDGMSSDHFIRLHKLRSPIVKEYIYIYIYIVLYSPVCVQRTGRKTDVVRARPDCASCPQNGTRDTAGRRVKCLDLIKSGRVHTIRKLRYIQQLRDAPPFTVR